VSRAYIDDKSDGNITRAPPLLSRLFIYNIGEGNHEPFSLGGVCWSNDRCSGLNVGTAWHCLASSPNEAAPPATSYWKGRSQSQCAGAYTAAVGLVAQSHGAGRTKASDFDYNTRYGLRAALAAGVRLQ
jgi:hypothetical protein